MKLINNDFSLEDFDAWSGAKDTKEVIIDNRKEEQFNYLIEELYPNGIEETELNDLLWHDSDYLYKCLNIREY